VLVLLGKKGGATAPPFLVRTLQHHNVVSCSDAKALTQPRLSLRPIRAILYQALKTLSSRFARL
jgi:hypothetical protein